MGNSLGGNSLGGMSGSFGGSGYGGSSPQLTRLKAAASHGHGSYSGGGSGGMGSCFTIDICPDLLISGLTAAAAAAFYFIYQAITVKAAGRKKRSFQNFVQSYNFNHLLDFFTVGNF